MIDRSLRAERFETKLTFPTTIEYLLFMPADYSLEGSRRWPLILFLHGAGERGSDLKRVAKHGPLKFARPRAQFPFVVAAPQCPKGQHWSNEALLALLQNVIRRHAIDTARIYLTGLSMGGYGTWTLAVEHPEKFAAAAPVCGGGSILPVLLAEAKKRRALRALPIWAFHGERDRVVPVDESKRMVEALRAAGNQAKLTVYPEAEHDCWTETYGNAELYDWFLRQRPREQAFA